MKIYNKFVESKDEPLNKNDIWFDGSVFRIYKGGNWIPITLTKEAAERLIEYANSLYVYVIVDELPDSGEDDKIYILRENIEGSSVKLEEYIWDNGWKFVENFNSVNITSDSPIGYGDSENSAVLKGGDNQAISEGSVALGKDNISGLKGWYINNFNYVGSKYLIHISNQNTELGEYIEDDNFNNPYEVGDIISIQIGSIFTNIGCINHIKGNYITFDSLKYFSAPQSDPEKRYYCWVLSKPNAGVVDLGQNAMSCGLNNQSLSECAHAEGKNNKAIGKYAHVEGKENEGHYCSHVEGANNIASGNTSHAEGTDNRALNSNTHVEGRYTSAVGYASHAEGYGESLESSTEAYGEGSHAEGRCTKAQGNYSHAEGQYTSAVGIASHAEGKGESLTNPNKAEGNYSHVEGEKTKASGISSHSEGIMTESIGKASHSEGRETKTTKDYSHAEGYLSEAAGISSHAEGVGTQTKNNGEHAEGRFNKSNSVAPNEGSNPKNTLHSVGMGTSDTARKNAHEIMQDGKHYILGIGGYNGTNPDKATDVASELTELSAEVSGLSERIENLPSGESSVFEAVYGETTYDEIIAEYNANKHVIVKFGEEFLSLARVTKNNIDFTNISADTSILARCFSDNKWAPYSIPLEKTTNKTKTINAESTDTQYPSAKAVYDAIQQSGGGSTTPDWNAQPGEAGYIENRTHYMSVSNPNIDEIIVLDSSGDDMNNYYVHTFEDVTISNDTFVIQINDNIDSIYEVRRGEECNISFDEYGSSFYYSVSYNNNDNVVIKGNRYQQIRVRVWETNLTSFIKTINEKFIPNTIARKSDIPNTVVKTTPQELSDTDKNQALANLGIDPIVWKYICNPLIIGDGMEVPDELYDEDRHWLKYEYPAMYRFCDDMEYKFCVKADYDILTDSTNQNWYINMKTFYME